MHPHYHHQENNNISENFYPSEDVKRSDNQSNGGYIPTRTDGEEYLTSVFERGWKHEFLKEYLNLQERLVTKDKEFDGAHQMSSIYQTTKTSTSSTPTTMNCFLPKLSKNLVNMLLTNPTNKIDHSRNLIDRMLTSSIPQKEEELLSLDDSRPSSKLNYSEDLLPSAETSKFFSNLMDCDGKSNINYQEFVESWHEYKKAALANNMDPQALITQSAKLSKKAATRETTSMLKSWLNEHKKNPYPTKGEKIMLAVITRMNLTQVSTWFANARRRLKKENKMTWNPKNRNDPTIGSINGCDPVNLLNGNRNENDLINSLGDERINKNSLKTLFHDQKEVHGGGSCYTDLREILLNRQLSMSEQNVDNTISPKCSFGEEESPNQNDIQIQNILSKIFSIMNSKEHQQSTNESFPFNNTTINGDLIARLSNILQSQMNFVEERRSENTASTQSDFHQLPCDMNNKSDDLKSIIGSKRSIISSNPNLEKNESSYLSENSNSPAYSSSGTNTSDINKRPKIWSIIETN